jgi:hypothetical protein
VTNHRHHYCAIQFTTDRAAGSVLGTVWQCSCGMRYEQRPGFAGAALNETPGVGWFRVGG